jgi:hypothetical protein
MLWPQFAKPEASLEATGLERFCNHVCAIVGLEEPRLFGSLQHDVFWLLVNCPPDSSDSREDARHEPCRGHMQEGIRRRGYRCGGTVGA